MPLDQVQAYQMLRSYSSIPVAGGENLKDAKQFLPLLTAGALDVIQPDMMHVNGVDGFRDTMKLGRIFGMRASPHAFDGALSRLYALFALACQPPWSKMDKDDIEPLEWDVMDNPFTELLSVRPSGGSMKVPNGIGLGAELDIDRINQYLWDGSTYH